MAEYLVNLLPVTTAGDHMSANLPPLGEKWHPTPVLLPGKSHGRRSLVGCSPLGREESDTTERLHFPFSLSCIGKGNGNLLQCSCLENPRDGGAWWAAICGVAQSWTWLTRLSSSRGKIWRTNTSSGVCWYIVIVCVFGMVFPEDNFKKELASLQIEIIWNKGSPEIEGLEGLEK